MVRAARSGDARLGVFPPRQKAGAGNGALWYATMVESLGSSLSGVSVYQRTASYSPGYSQPSTRAGGDSSSFFGATASATDATFTTKSADRSFAADKAGQSGFNFQQQTDRGERGGRIVRDQVDLSPRARTALNAQQEFQYRQDTGLSLAAANLSGISLVDQDLSQTQFAGANLSAADLAYSNFAGANFAGANLQGTNFLNADVTGAAFSGADLRGADLAGVTGLTQDQISQAKYDSSTRLPFNLQ